ncbi:LD-carboxypeptidase [Oscillospiraceae bacterium]|nr:LD-carboxypeptidase [Oscillospiraceae bacterium]BDF73638.1 LD-carboxypeptidase [Oscillospiraceae bacterium]
MIRPRRLRPGDTVAVVSLSWGGLGEAALVHRYGIARRRLEEDFGLKVRPMPHALKGSAFAAAHPELRARDLMEAFRDPDVAGIFCAIGGDDTIRTLPYVDLDVIRANPKAFMGYSDSTINHFMMYKAGLVSFYGPSVMAEFGEYVEMAPYTAQAVRRVLFGDCAGWAVPSSPVWSEETVPWDEGNAQTPRRFRPDTHGYEVLQGTGTARGHLLGGCLDVFMMAIGTAIWPPAEAWRGALLFLETSEEKPSPEFVTRTLRNLAAQGILRAVNGILFGKPQGEVYYEEYKRAILQVVAEEEGLEALPILYNVNVGHAVPIGVLPYGVRAELDCDNRRLTLLESATL